MVPEASVMFFNLNIPIKIQGVDKLGNVVIYKRVKTYGTIEEVKEAVEDFKKENDLNSALALRTDSQYILYRTPEKYRKGK